MPKKASFLLRSRSWLREDRGLQTHALQAPDNPRLPIASQLRPPTSEPVQRWWLRDLTRDKSLFKGLFEAMTGHVPLWAEPNSRSQCFGLMRAGTRFMAKPKVVQGSVWLKVQTRGVSPPLFSNRSEVLFATCDESPHHRHFATSGPPVLPITQDFADVSEMWIEYNMQYVKRIRDLGREQGRTSYSIISKPRSREGC
ncbi:unnamed protein product [Durusdinium trenchii]|uniref:Uncharacterized protein n=2 Tax=Durusdinium trenchii TaxID=1381693 RepID=A0ABP0J6R3_9DINO